MKEVVRKGLVWASAGRSAALFLLPLPLLAAVLGALIAGDLDRLGLAGGALASFWTSGTLVFRALAAEARYLLGQRTDPPGIPMKLLTAMPTALGAALAALAAAHTPESALVFAALGAAGHAAFFGRDLRPRRIEVAVVTGVDRTAVTLQLKGAYARLRGIDTAARRIAVPEFRERLSRITTIGRSVLGEIERDPADAARARRFLNLYLDSAEQVTADYARSHGHARNQALEENFRQLLVDMEQTFAEQHRKLLEHELLSLDVDIEVLNTRIKREGLG
jgi:5-bromo-4-chloroindolyl phosphate hydrolysis protein